MEKPQKSHHKVGIGHMAIFSQHQWAVILGGSSGFGLSAAAKLSHEGMSVCILHRDRRGAMGRINEAFDTIKANGNGFVALNTNALDDEDRHKAIEALYDAMGAQGRVRLLLHSIAFGNLKPLVPPLPNKHQADSLGLLASELNISPASLADKVASAFDKGAHALHGLNAPHYGDQVLSDEDFARTIYAMGTSLAAWVQHLHRRALFSRDARVLSLTSEGNQVAWRGYAAVSAAKAALEAVSRAIALEYGPHGIRANIIQAGVTDTPALKAIPGSQRMKAVATLRNPLGRLTTPRDVADAICLMCLDEAGWINGALLRVDGGEHIASL